MLRPAFALRPPRLFAARRWSLALVFVVAAAIAAVWARAIMQLTQPKPVPVVLRPEAVAWGSRVFSDEHHLAIWLRSQGVSYERWRRLHPAALRILTPRAPVSAAKRETSPPPPKRTRTAVRERATPKLTASRSSGLAFSLWVLIGAAGIAPLLVTVGISLRAQRHRRMSPLALESRFYLVAISAAVLAGVFVARIIA